ncbi:MAG: ion transporter [Candidatus Hydrogenedentes bacterium]|nr:ion transporter [Candidatus Hydrogenedentota bacterium]
MKLRSAVWKTLGNEKREGKLSRVVNAALVTLIATNVLAVILGTVHSVELRFGRLLYAFEVFSVAAFTIEYLLRLWACAEDVRYNRAFVGRLRYAITPMAIIDLAAIAPFYFAGFGGLDLRYLRALRLMRIVAVLKVGRYMHALHVVKSVLHVKREELLLTGAVMGLLLIIASAVMYQVEHEAQPEQFPDIPSTMWWAVATLTTVGYGDVYPVTTAGRIVTAAVAILGIGFFALPTGILGAGFIEEIQRTKAQRRCPHCGELIDQ